MPVNPSWSPTNAVSGGNGATWVDKFGRIRRPNQTFYADDGAVHHGQDAVQTALRRGLAVQDHNRCVVERMTALQRRRFARWVATGRPVHRRPAGTARPRTRERRPVAARRTGASSSTSSSDPPDGEPDPDRGLVRNFSGWVPCPFCRAPLVEELHGTRCPVCAITWWRWPL